MFRSWSSRLPRSVEVHCAQLPGRGMRLHEAAVTQMKPLVRALAQAINPHLNSPFALFGHSMGAAIAFELAHLLRKENGREPVHLFISARRAPHMPDRMPPTYNLPKDDFINELRRLKGTPKEVLDHRELLNLMIPVLRSDFELIQTYQHTPGPPLGCPLTAFGGSDDLDVTLEELEGWQDYTAHSFQVLILPGDHFFLHTAQSLLLQSISRIFEHAARR
ncbi:MAG: alpha/beta fold hydrolase [Blastocatellia bacterium]|nr:alpha/beta fold hydrolase [Blastocatellia bacterium]